MATPTVKSTYSLDLETVRALERLAKRWEVSKSEALRRAIRAAIAGTSGREVADDENGALQAWQALQRSLKLTPARAAAWARQVRAERKASSVRRLG